MSRSVLGSCCFITLLGLIVWTPAARGYPSYDDGTGVGCVQCHPTFKGGPQHLLHNLHLSNFDIGECNLCHPNGSGSTPVLTYWSGPGGGFGCAGCHGRDYGETSPNSAQPKATAYGLRQHHANNGITVCQTCHIPGAFGAPDPLPAILGEDVAPPYYGLPASSLFDPCSSAEEDMAFDTDLLGLDNDGDGSPDWPADTDCSMPTTTTTTSTTTTTLGCGAVPMGGCLGPEKGTLTVKENVGGKEKLKVVLKKLKSTVAQGQFGDPVTGGTSYAICIYDELDILRGEITVRRAGDVCGSPPKQCWKAVSDKGYKYGDKGAAADGIVKMLMKGGDPGKGKIIVTGRNNAGKGQTSLPTGIAAALLNNAKATVQVVTSDADCFGVTTAAVKKADGSQFKASGGSPSAAFVDNATGGVLE